MISFIDTPQEVSIHLAKQAQALRLSLDLSQKTLSERSGVSLGVIKRFERTGKISLESLLKLAVILGALDQFVSLFKPKEPQAYSSLDEILQEKKRQRGRH